MSKQHSAFELVQAASNMVDHVQFGNLDEDQQADRIGQARFYLYVAKERTDYFDSNVQKFLAFVTDRVSGEEDRLGFED